MYHELLDFLATTYLESDEDLLVLGYVVDLIQLTHSDHPDDIPVFSDEKKAQFLADFMHRVSENKNTKRSEIKRVLQEK